MISRIIWHPLIPNPANLFKFGYSAVTLCSNLRSAVSLPGSAANRGECVCLGAPFNPFGTLRILSCSGNVEMVDRRRNERKECTRHKPRGKPSLQQKNLLGLHLSARILILPNAEAIAQNTSSSGRSAPNSELERRKQPKGALAHTSAFEKKTDYVALPAEGD